MSRTDALRLVAALGAIEMALVRRDEVVGPLLAQAARAARGDETERWMTTAAAIVRAPGFYGEDPALAARRKVVQALCRAAAQAAQAAVLIGLP
jgi:hypothetical protein